MTFEQYLLSALHLLRTQKKNNRHIFHLLTNNYCLKTVTFLHTQSTRTVTSKQSTNHCLCSSLELDETTIAAQRNVKY